MSAKAGATLKRMAQKRLERLNSSDQGKPVEVKTDFASFCEAIRIVPKEGGERVPLHLNAIQAIFEVERTGRDIVLKPRQIGFTTLELARDLWTLMTKEGARVVVVYQSSTDNATGNLLSTIITTMIEGLIAAGWPVRFRTQAKYEWVLHNGNSLRITQAGASETSASKKGRAGTITRLHITELAFYDFPDETLNAMMECVPKRSSGSEIVIESTANGASGMFYDYCGDAQAGKSSFKFHFYPWYRHPEYFEELEPGEEIVPQDEDEVRLEALGCTPGQLKWRRQKIVDKRSIDKFNQEYPDDAETCFIVSGQQFFDKKKLAELLKTAEDPIEVRDHGRIRIYKRPDPSVVRQKFMLCVDTAEGAGDPIAGIMYDWQTGEHVATIDGQYIPFDCARAAAKLAKEYNNAQIVVERNNHGHAVILALTQPDVDRPQWDDETDIDYESRLYRPMYDNVYIHEDEKIGFYTQQANRPALLDTFQDSVANGAWKSKDRMLIKQMRSFVMKDGKPQGGGRAKDDMVMGAGIGWFVRQQARMNGFRPNIPQPDATGFVSFSGDERGFG